LEEFKEELSKEDQESNKLSPELKEPDLESEEDMLPVKEALTLLQEMEDMLPNQEIKELHMSPALNTSANQSLPQLSTSQLDTPPDMMEETEELPMLLHQTEDTSLEQPEALPMSLDQTLDTPPQDNLDLTSFLTDTILDTPQETMEDTSQLLQDQDTSLETAVSEEDTSLAEVESDLDLTLNKPAMKLLSNIDDSLRFHIKHNNQG